MTYAKQARYTKALQDFERATEVGPPNSFVFRNKGEILNELGRYEEALRAYNEALRFNSEDVEAYIGRGQSFNQLGHYEQALTSFEEALDLCPDSASAYRGKGYALNGLERYVEALVTYNKALELDANSAEAYRGKGKALRSLLRYAEASVAYIRANELDPQDQEDVIGEEDIQENTTVQKAKQAISNNHKDSTRLWERLAQFFHLAPLPRQNRSHTLGHVRSTSTVKPFSSFLANGFAWLAVIVIIGGFVLATFSLKTSIGGPVKNATATAVTSNPNTNAYPPRGATLVLNDPLSGQDANQWSVDTECAFTGGSFHASVHRTDYFGYCGTSAITVSNFAYEVHMSILRGDYGGIVFYINSASSTSQSFYYFRIGTDSSYGLYLYKGTGGFGQELQGGTSSTINTGLNQSNVIAVVASNNNFDLYVNKQFIISVKDSTYNSGYIGVIAVPRNSLTDVAFSNAKVWTF